MILTHGANSLSRGGSYEQGWTEDENVTTSLGHSIPVEDCGIEMGLQSIREMPFMHTLEEDCGIEMSLISVEEITQ